MSGIKKDKTIEEIEKTYEEIKKILEKTESDKK